MSQHLSFSPEELTFTISDHAVAETKLHIKNHGDSPCAFKVKTTTPDRYLVKPNHGLIHQNAVTELSIVIVKAKQRDIVSEAKSGGGIMCTDKFLVQSLVVNKALMKELVGRTSSELAGAITHIFKEQKTPSAKKLLVQFRYLEETTDRYQASLGPSTGFTESVKTLTPEINSVIPGTPEATFTEIIALRKKYDDLVAFAVRLTAERDSFSAELQATKKVHRLHNLDKSEHRQLSNEVPIREQAKNSPIWCQLQLLFAVFLAFMLGNAMCPAPLQNN